MWPEIEVTDRSCCSADMSSGGWTMLGKLGWSNIHSALGGYKQMNQRRFECGRLDDDATEEVCGLEAWITIGFTFVMIGHVLHYEDPPYANGMVCLVDFAKVPYHSLIPRRTKRVSAFR